MSDIDVDDSKSEILDVGDAGSDNIGDEEVWVYLLKSPQISTIKFIGDGQTSSAHSLCLLSCHIRREDLPSLHTRHISR